MTGKNPEGDVGCVTQGMTQGSYSTQLLSPNWRFQINSKSNFEKHLQNISAPSGDRQPLQDGRNDIETLGNKKTSLGRKGDTDPPTPRGIQYSDTLAI